MNNATKTIPQILRDNICTVFNALNLMIAVALAAVGAWKNILFIFIILINTVVGIVQEIKAKRQIERLTLLAQPVVTVLRGGEETTIRPEEIRTGDVLVLTGEDDPGKVLKARYIAAGADVSKIFVLSSDEYFDRAGKILTIKDAALAEYAAKFDPALLIIDPLQSFLPADVEMGSRNQMRSAIVPLRGISKRQNCAALISMHSNKKQGVSGRARLADSSDIWDIARSVLMMGRSKNDGKTYLSHEKSSYCAPQQTVLLHIEDTAVEGIPTARAVFDGYTDKKDADFIEEKRFRTAQTKDDTAAAILNTLAECRLGSMASNELRSAVTREIGCSQGTYNRAYGALVKSGEIEKFQLNQKDGIRGWFSRLPLTG